MQDITNRILNVYDSHTRLTDVIYRVLNILPTDNINKINFESLAEQKHSEEEFFDETSLPIFSKFEDILMDEIESKFSSIEDDYDFEVEVGVFFDRRYVSEDSNDDNIDFLKSTDLYHYLINNKVSM